MIDTFFLLRAPRNGGGRSLGLCLHPVGRGVCSDLATLEKSKTAHAWQNINIYLQIRASAFVFQGVSPDMGGMPFLILGLNTIVDRHLCFSVENKCWASCGDNAPVPPYFLPFRHDGRKLFLSPNSAMNPQNERFPIHPAGQFQRRSWRVHLAEFLPQGAGRKHGKQNMNILSIWNV